MKVITHIPSSLFEAAQQLRVAWRRQPATLTKSEFVRLWSSVFYLFPGLHPDGFDNQDSGWPAALKRFAAEAWRRVDAGEIADDELYPTDAQWAGIYDRMRFHTPEEALRRAELARTSAA